MPSQYELIELPGRFAVCRLAGDAPIPPWATAGAFFSITRTADELSILIDETSVPVGWDQLAGTPLPCGRGAGGEGTSRVAAEASLSHPTSEGIRCERGWRGLRVAGAVPFATVGLLAGLLSPLAEAGISVFAVSTFDTDYVFTKEEQWALALDVFRRRGYRIR